MVRVTKLELHRTISDIMGNGNLDQLTTKKIRILCEQKYNIDLTSRKEEIDRIVMAFVLKKSVDEQMALPKPQGAIPKSQEPIPKPKEPIPKDESSNDENSSLETDEASSCSSRTESQSCSNSECSYSESSDEAPAPKAKAVKKVKVSSKPEPKVQQKKTGSVVSRRRRVVSRAPKKVTSNKKQKKDVGAKKIELDDATYARQLQAEEWNFRQRTSRKLFRDIPQRKSGKNEQAKKKKATPFLKKCSLSPALAELMGTNEMSRPDIVQKMWTVVRERQLFDPTNKQYAKCDEQLMKLFGKKRVRLIGMMKYLKHHIKDIR